MRTESVVVYPAGTVKFSITFMKAVASTVIPLPDAAPIVKVIWVVVVIVAKY
jgi:hypothetical protein